MKKITQNLRWLVTLLTMIVSMGAWATDFTLSSAENITQDGITVSFDKALGSSTPAWYDAGLRLYANNTITISSANNITGITFNWEKQGSKAFASVIASVGTYTHPSAAGEGTWTGSSKSITFTLGSSGQLQLNTFTVTCETGGENPVETVATPTFSVAEGTYTETQSVVISCTTEDATIYYTTDGNDPTINSTEYSGAIEISKTTTVKAIAVKEGYDNSEVATAIYTITIPVSGYTIDFESSLNCYVDWEINNIGLHNSEITAHGGTYYGANVNGDDNGVATATIKTKKPVANPTLFSCYVSKESSNTSSSTWYVQVSSDGDNWENVASQDATSMSKGKWIAMTADLSDYSNVYVRLYYNGSTAKRAVDDISITLGGTPKVATPTFSVAGGEYTEAQSVEISCTTEGATIYYTTDGNTPTESSTVYSGAIEISSNTTLKAIAVKSEMRNSDEAEVTYTINIPQPVSEAQYALVTSNDQLEAGKEYIIVGKNSTSYYAMSTTQYNNNRGIVGITVSGDIATISSSDVQVITLEGSSEGWYFKAGNGYLYAASSGSNWLRTEEEADDNAKATIGIASNGDATIKFQGTNTRNLLRFNSNNSIFSCYGSGQSPVQLYKKVTVDVTVTAAGYATYSNPEVNLDFSNVEGLTAYYVKSAPYEGSLVIEEAGKVPAGTAVLLAGAEGTYNVPVCASAEEPTTNLLQVADASTVGNGESIFVLANGNKGVGFYVVKNGSSIPEGKAYLVIEKPADGQTVKSFFSLGGDDANAINGVEAEVGTGIIYNLNGQRVAAPVKGGLYIMNGKKMLVK